MSQTQAFGLLAARDRAGEGAIRSAPLPKVVRVFWTASLVVFILSLAVAGAEHRLGLAETRWNGWSDPLLGDLMEYPGTYQLLHRAAFFNNAAPDSLPASMFSAVAYPPLAAAVLALVYLSFSPVLVFLGAASAWLIFVFWHVRRTLVRAGISSTVAALFPFSLMLTSFPVQRLVHQGNMELVVWGAVSAGVWAFWCKKECTASSLWGIAAALKLYPILLLLLLLPRRSYRALLLGVGAFSGSTLLSLWWLGPTVAIAWKGSLRNVLGYQNLRVSEWSLRELVANHSILGWVKLGAFVAHVPLQKLALPYYGCAVVLLGWSFLTRLRYMPVLNQLLALSIAMLLIPPISYYHTLVQIYAPLLMLVLIAIRAQGEAVRIRGLQLTMLLFIPLSVPYPLLTLPRMFLFCGLLQAIVLLLLFLCAMAFPFTDPLNPLDPMAWTAQSCDDPSHAA